MLEIGGTFYVPEGTTRTVRLPSVDGDVLVWTNRGEVFIPAYVEEAESDGLLLLNQYNAERIVEAIRAAVEYGDVDPSDGKWLISRSDEGELDVSHELATSAGDAMR